MIKNEELRTPWKVRLAVGLIGVAMLLSTLAIYFTVFVQYGEQTDAMDESAIAKMQEEYDRLYGEVSTLGSTLSDQYFETFKAYRSEVKAFNAESLEYGVRDLKVGDGRMLDAATDPYMAYYIGWQADETIIDSSFNNTDEPTMLRLPLRTTNLIKGLQEGIVGMRIGGVREFSLPSEYAYDEGPLKFIFMLIPYEDSQLQLLNDFEVAATAMDNLGL